MNIDLSNDHLEPQTAALIKLGMTLGAGEGSSQFAVVPDGTTLKDLEPFQDRPRRTKATVHAETIGGAIAYFRDHQSEEETAIFVSRRNARLRIIFDYHVGPGEPRWCTHDLRYDAPVAREWETWALTNDEKWMSQVDFADFLEDNLPDVADLPDEDEIPSPSDLLSCARRLQGKRNVTFKSAQVPGTGDVEFQYETKTKAQGLIEVPERFAIAIPPFEGSDLFEVRARLRWRLSDEGQVRFSYKLIRPDEKRETAFDEQVEQLREAAGDTPVYYAQP